jgi:hypothetical protein
LLFGFTQQQPFASLAGDEFGGSFADAFSKTESNHEAATASGITNGEEPADPRRRNMPSAGERPFLLPFCGRLDKKEGA